MDSKLKFLLRVAFSVILFLLGAVVAFVFSVATTPGGLLGQKIGLALIVAGCIAVFQEAVFRPLTVDEVKGGFDRVLNLLRGPAIHLETLKRRGYPGYHRWLVDGAAQTVFFAGHSVLHRMEDDFGDLPLKSIEKAFAMKLSQGCNIRLLFLDPRWVFLDNVADAQERGRQDPKELRKNLATSLGVIKRISAEMDNRAGPMPGSLEIRVCSEVTQYAYHYVECKDRDSSEMYVGLYFAGELGTESPLFVVDNKDVRSAFQRHFDRVFTNAVPLLSQARGQERPVLNSTCYRECQKSLAEKIGEEEVAKRCP